MSQAPTVLQKLGISLLQRYGFILKGYTSAFIFCIIMLLVFLAGFLAPELWTPGITSLKIVYIIAFPLWNLAIPLYWFYYRFGEIPGWIVLISASFMLLVGFAWLLQVFRSHMLQTVLSFCLGMLVFAMLMMIALQFYGPIYIDEIF